MIPLGGFTPDLPANGAHSTVAHNCVPAVGYYSPFYTGVRYGDALGETCTGAYASRGNTGTPYNFAGSASYLKRMVSAAWEDVSIVGGYTTGSGRWDFTSFGNRVIATNGSQNPQSFVIGTSTDFANLTTAFKSRTVAVVKGFVMHGYIDDGTVYRNRVRWSALEDATDYTPSTTTMSGYQDLYGETDVGNVVKIHGGEFATIFCERGIFRGTFTGGDYIFQFDQIVRNQGCRAAGSVASHGDMLFFLGNDGFYILSSQGLIPIGEGQVNRTFLSELYTSNIEKISATVDPYRSLYIVAMPTTATGLDKIYMYNWNSQRWSTADTGGVDAMFTFLSESWTLDGSSTAVGDMDLGTYADVPLDSPFFIGGEPSIGAIDTSGYIITYNGATKTAEGETGETQIFPGQRALVKNAIPYVEGSGSTVQARVGYRNTPQEAVTYTDWVTMNSEGECNLFCTAKYQRLGMKVSGGFTKMSGFDFDAVPAGKY